MSTALDHDNKTSCRGTLRDGQFIRRVASPYSPAQIVQWLSCIGYPDVPNEASVASGAFPANLENLELLMRLSLLTFPFENTAMYYTEDHMMDVSYEGTFQRLVNEQKGSYCFGLNGLFLGMLRGLGYRAFGSSARVNESGVFTPLSHLVIFVQPSETGNETYVVDVGFGSSCLARPILLSDAEENVVMGTTPSEKHRLTRKPHPSSSIGKRDFFLLTYDQTNADPSRSDLLWNLEVWHSKNGDDDGKWTTILAFTEVESFRIDWDAGSWVICTRQSGIFRNVVCVRHALLDEEIRNEERFPAKGLELARTSALKSSSPLCRYVMSGREVKRHAGGQSELVRKLETEKDRIQALREIFKIGIPEHAEDYIAGRAAALP